MTLFAALTYAALLHATAAQDAPTMPTAPAQPRTLIVIGASYAADWGQPAVPGHRIVNRGVGGQETSDLLARFERDVITQAPQAVLIWGHYNDIVRATPERMKAAKQRAKQNLQSMAEQARSAGVAVMLATEITMPIGDGWMDQLLGLIGRLRGKEDFRAGVNRNIKEVNHWVREYARSNKLILLDFEAALNAENGSRNPLYAKPDGSHITAEGYRALTQYFSKTLSSRPN